MKVVLKEVGWSDEARVVASVAEDFDIAFDRCVEKIGGRGAGAMEDHGCPGYFTVCKRSGAVVGKFYVKEVKMKKKIYPSDRFLQFLRSVACDISSARTSIQADLMQEVLDALSERADDNSYTITSIDVLNFIEAQLKRYNKFHIDEEEEEDLEELRGYIAAEKANM